MSSQDKSEELKTKIDLGEDEKIEYFTRKHWVALIPSLIVPTLIVLVCFPLFIYRAVGGTFITMSNSTLGFDTVNIILSCLFVGAVFLIFSFLKDKKRVFERQIVTAFAVLLALIIGFRYQGGRIFAFDPMAGSVQRFDIINLVLLGLAILSIVYIGYTYYEWNDDFLILTNQRVLTWNEVLLGSQSQKQVYIEDIQSVTASTNTYLQHWLDFGTVSVTSASYGPKLEFKTIHSPRTMQKKIDDKLRALQSQRSKQNFDGMILAKVYNKPSPPRPAPRLKLLKSPPLVRLLFDENPEVAEDGTITWRPHWIFIPIVALKPVIFLILAFVVVFFANQFIPLGIVNLIALLFVIVIFFVVWAAYVIEDERNELYILKRDSIIDVEKKPFGPERRKSAKIDAIQNVEFNTTFFGRFFGYGNVLIDTAGAGGRFTFPRLPNPKEVVDTINMYRKRYKDGEKERAMGDSLTLIKHYHELELKRMKEEQAAAVAFPPDHAPEPVTAPMNPSPQSSA